MPGASRNWILCCCCSQDAVPGGQHGCARATDSRGTSERQVKIWTVTETHCNIFHVLSHKTRHHDAASEWVQIWILFWPTTLQHQSQRWSLEAADERLCYSNTLMMLGTVVVLLLQHSRIQAVRGEPRHYTLIFLFTVKKKSSLQLATYIFTVLATPQKSSSQWV